MQAARQFNGPITFTELAGLAGTTHYNGEDGATALPLGIVATLGFAPTLIKSVSQTVFLSVPDPAMIEATAPRTRKHESTNPLMIKQWVPVSDALLSPPAWHFSRLQDILACFQSQSDPEVKAAANAVQVVVSAKNITDCGQNPREDRPLPEPFTIYVRRVCDGNGKAMRLNDAPHRFSEVVIHEARHAWQKTQLLTPGNDEDKDRFVKTVQFLSAAQITEGFHNQTDDSPDSPTGTTFLQADAQAFGQAHANKCAF